MILARLLFISVFIAHGHFRGTRDSDTLQKSTSLTEEPPSAFIPASRTKHSSLLTLENERREAVDREESQQRVNVAAPTCRFLKDEMEEKVMTWKEEELEKVTKWKKQLECGRE